MAQNVQSVSIGWNWRKREEGNTSSCGMKRYFKETRDEAKEVIASDRQRYVERNKNEAMNWI